MATGTTAKIISQSMLDLIQKPAHVMEIDAINNVPVTIGWGFNHSYSPTVCQIMQIVLNLAGI